MARSRWKFFFLNKLMWRYAFLYTINPVTWGKSKIARDLVFKARASHIPIFLNKNFVYVHSGKYFLEVDVGRYHVGTKLGEYAYTRKMFYYPMRKKQKPRK